MYEDYKEMLLNPEIDAVMISTPDHWHAQPAIEAVLAGKDIYLQKPTSLTIAEGRLLSDIARKKGTILQLGTQQRSSKQFRLAAELVRNGRIGKLHTVKVGLPGDPSGPEWSGGKIVLPWANVDVDGSCKHPFVHVALGQLRQYKRLLKREPPFLFFHWDRTGLKIAIPPERRYRFVSQYRRQAEMWAGASCAPF